MLDTFYMKWVPTKGATEKKIQVVLMPVWLGFYLINLVVFVVYYSRGYISLSLTKRHQEPLPKYGKID